MYFCPKEQHGHHMLWKANISLLFFPHVSPRVGCHQGEHVTGKVESVSVYSSNIYVNSADILECQPIIVPQHIVTIYIKHPNIPHSILFILCYKSVNLMVYNNVQL
jgi:hypothetical protein